MSEWQPIETAPKDGAVVLLWGPGWWHATTGTWDGDIYGKTPRPFWRSDHDHLRGRMWMRASQPTHWQPLPEPPQ